MEESVTKKKRTLYYERTNGGFCSRDLDGLRDVLEVPVDVDLLGYIPLGWAFVVAGLAVGNITAQQAISRIASKLYKITDEE